MDSVSRKPDSPASLCKGAASGFWGAVRSSGGWSIQTLLAMLLLLSGFLLSRLPTYLFFPYPDASSDTGSYLVMLGKIADGIWPTFEWRTPGYPFFLGLCLKLTGSGFGVVIVQHLLTLASAGLMVWCVAITYRRFTLLAGAGMFFLVMRNYSIMHDNRLYPDSLYASIIVAAFALLIPAVRRRSAPLFAVISLLFALAILVRPAGLFLVVVWVLCICHMLRNRWGWRPVLAMAAPFPAPILALMLYNLLTIGFFSVSPFGSIAIAGTVISYVEPHPSYPPELNETLVKVNSSVSQAEKDVIETSWDLNLLHRIFIDIYEKQPQMIPESENSILRYNRFLSDAAMRAIRKHPKYHLKFVLSMLHHYFMVNPDVDSCVYLAYHCQRQLAVMAGENIHPRFRDKFRERGEQHPVAVFDDSGEAHVSPWYSAYHAVYAVVNPLFRNTAVSLALFILVFFSFAAALRSRFRDDDAFIALIFGLSSLGAGMLVCLVDISLFRFSYVMEFVNYLAPVLLAACLPAPLKAAIASAWAGLRVRDRIFGCALGSVVLAAFLYSFCTTYYKHLYNYGPGCGKTLLGAFNGSVDNNPAMLNDLGAALLNNGKTEQAVYCFWEAAQRAPSAHNILNNMAVGMMIIKRPEAAARWFERLLGVAPDNGDAREFLVSYWMDRGGQAVFFGNDDSGAAMLAKGFMMDRKSDGLAGRLFGEIMEKIRVRDPVRASRVAEKVQACLTPIEEKPVK